VRGATSADKSHRASIAPASFDSVRPIFYSNKANIAADIRANSIT
jgi:hypothetical protein